MVYEEETVSSEKVERIREEMDERFNQMANNIRTSQELIAKSFNAAVEAKMEGLLQQFFEQFKVHQPPGPVPDSHVSNNFHHTVTWLNHAVCDGTNDVPTSLIVHISLCAMESENMVQYPE